MKWFVTRRFKNKKTVSKIVGAQMSQDDPSQDLSPLENLETAEAQQQSTNLLLEFFLPIRFYHLSAVTTLSQFLLQFDVCHNFCHNSSHQFCLQNLKTSFLFWTIITLWFLRQKHLQIWYFATLKLGYVWPLNLKVDSQSPTLRTPDSTLLEELQLRPPSHWLFERPVFFVF